MEYNFNMEDVTQQCINAINKKYSDLKKLNVIVTGKSGAGKSTLINSLFRENFAETGLGRPVTDGIRKIEKKDYPLAVYDTPGFELSGEQQTKVREGIFEIINSGLASENINKAIHCIWYCINTGGNRTFDETEIKWLKELTENNKTTQVPIIVILTQAVPRKKAAEMKNLVEQESLGIVKVVPVLAQDMDFDKEYTAKSYGLDTLINIMSEILPDELEDTLQNIQKVSLEAKKRRAQAAIKTAAITAVALGASPIPFADAALLVPAQITMITSITVAFGLEVNKSLVTGFLSSTIGTAGATVLGKTVVSNLLKMIPGAGSVAGGMISGATAGLLTTALGEAYIGLMERVFKGEMKKEDIYSEKGKNVIQELFNKELSIERKNN